MVSSLLIIILTVPLSSLGSLIQTSHSLDNSEFARKTRSTGRNKNVPDSLFSEATFNSENGSDSLEGSGQTVEATASHTLIKHTFHVTPKEPEPAGN